MYIFINCDKCSFGHGSWLIETFFCVDGQMIPCNQWGFGAFEEDDQTKHDRTRKRSIRTLLMCQSCGFLDHYGRELLKRPASRIRRLWDVHLSDSEIRQCVCRRCALPTLLKLTPLTFLRKCCQYLFGIPANPRCPVCRQGEIIVEYPNFIVN